MPEIDLSHWSSTQFEDPPRRPNSFLPTVTRRAHLEEVFQDVLKSVMLGCECHRRRKWKWRHVCAVDEAPVSLEALCPNSDSARELVEARR